MALHLVLLPRSSQDLQGRHGSPRKCSTWNWAASFSLFLVLLFIAFGAFNQRIYNRKDSNKIVENLFHGDPSQPLNFLVVGDWGREGKYNQSEIAVQMGRVGEELAIQFVVSVGDNFYETGLKGVDDPAFAASFTDIYTAPSLQTTWYTVLGNHDYMGDVLAQLSDEIVKRDPRWFCRREFELRTALCKLPPDLGDCHANIDMFFIDTTPFVNEYWENQTQSFDWRGLAPRADQLRYQLEDLEINLRNSDATWKMVLGHHPIHTVGHHGDTIELVNQVLPILEKYKVDAYINGHDHNVQHIKRADSPIHFITSGGGSKAYNGLQPYGEGAGVQFVFDGQGFVAVSVMPAQVSFKYYDVFRATLYSFVLKK